jgi:uncharacterized protein (DUF2267 family)
MFNGTLDSTAADNFAAILPAQYFNHTSRRKLLEGEYRLLAAECTEYQFLEEVRRMVGLEDESRAEEAVVCVFSVLQEALGSPSGREGEARHVFSQLPRDLKQLWLSAAEQNVA